MNTVTNTSSAATGNNKPLWIAVGVLGAAVLAMGATLVYQQNRQADPSLQALAVNPVISTDSVSNAPPALTGTQSVTPKIVAKPVTQSAPRPAVVPRPLYPTPVADRDGYGARYPVSQPPVRSVCSNCGQVESVTPVQRTGQGSGLGAVAGGVLGAIVGNQVGDGNGRKVATVLGAIGGGYAGNAVEKNIKKDTTYQIAVRMEDGSVRSFEQATPPAVGTRVTVDGNTLRGADAAIHVPAQRSLPQPGYTYTGY